jgi:hypothetical protein
MVLLSGVTFSALASDGGEGYHSIEGTLTAVNLEDRIITVNSQEYTLFAEVEIKVNDDHIPFERLPDLVGKFVEIKADASNNVCKIEVYNGGENEKEEIKGELQAVDLAARTIIVKEQTFIVSPEVVIEVEHKDGHLSFNQLDQYIGRCIEIKFNSNNVVFEMEIKDGTPDDDHIQGGKGNDDINGGEGNDEIHGGNGNDDLGGDEGEDEVHGDGGNDNLDGGDDNDTLNGDDGNDHLKGGKGNDRLNGDDDQPTLAAPAMTQMLARNSRRASNDVLDGGEGDDTINGGVGNDQIVGGLGKDIINAGDGNDQLWISAGDVPAGQTETIDCGAGRDKVNLRNFSKKSKPANGQLTDPATGGTYLFTNCEKFVVSRGALPRAAQTAIALASDISSTATLKIFTLSGQKVFESNSTVSDIVETLSTTNIPEQIINGVYFYVLTVHAADGTVLKSEVKKLVVLK